MHNTLAVLFSSLFNNSSLSSSIPPLSIKIYKPGTREQMLFHIMAQAIMHRSNKEQLHPTQ
jgi:hypothetical protein